MSSDEIRPQKLSMESEKKSSKLTSEVKPIKSATEKNPSKLASKVNPIKSATEKNPSKLASKVNHIKSASEKNPNKLASKVNPIKSATEKNPSKLASKVNSIKSATEKNPSKLASELKSLKPATEKKSNKLISEVKSIKSASEMKTQKLTNQMKSLELKDKTQSLKLSNRNKTQEIRGKINLLTTDNLSLKRTNDIRQPELSNRIIPLLEKDVIPAKRKINYLKETNTRPYKVNNFSNNVIPKLSVKYAGEVIPIDQITFEMSKELNQHTVVHMRGMVYQNIYDDIVHRTNAQTELEINYQIGTSNLLLFQGVILNIEAEAQGVNQNAVYYLDITAASFTYLLDIKLKSKSFQDGNMTYEQMIKQVLSDHSGANCYNLSYESEVIGGFTMQYKETDWNFIKRMASRFNAPLIANHRSKKPQFFFGLGPGSAAVQLGECEYRLLKNVDIFRENNQNYESDVNEFDFMNYEVTTTGADMESLEIGDNVLYKNRLFYVKAAKAFVKDHVLSHVYLLSTEKGFFCPPLFNEQITGLSLQGTVIKVARNLLKVHLDIDQSQSESKAYWFQYATFYSTFYCMPEKGDRVNVHFPTKDESDGIVINSIKQSPAAGASRGASTQELGKNSFGSAMEAAPLSALTSSLQGALSSSASTAGSALGGGGTSGSSLPVSAPSGTQGGGGGQSGGGAGAASGADTSEKKPNYDFENLADDEKVKMLVTDGGRMVILDDRNASVSIVCNDSTYIKLTDGNGISIITDLDITFETKEDINLTAEKYIYMKALEEIKLECGESLIEMKPEEILVQGVDIKLNK